MAWMLANNTSNLPLYILAAITILYVIFRPMLRRKKDPLEKLPKMSLSQQRAVEREMSNLLVELSDMARQVTAQLDTRSAKLEALIQEADRKIARLQRMTASRKQAAAPSRPVAVPADEGPADDRYTAIYELADQGRSPTEIARELSRPRGEVELILALRSH